MTVKKMQAKNEKVEQKTPSMYVFDLEKMMNFVFDKDGERSNNNVEITETYEANDNGGLQLVSRSAQETKGNASRSTSSDNIRYDLVKLFISSLDSMPVEIDSDEISFGEKVIINTMINEEFLKLV